MSFAVTERERARMWKGHRAPALDSPFVGSPNWFPLRLITGIISGLLQPQGVERLSRQFSSDGKTMVTLVFCDCGTRFLPEDPVDLAAVISFPRQSFLDGRDRRVAGLIGITILIVIDIAVSAGIIVPISVSVGVAVVIGIAVAIVVIVWVPPRPPRIKSDVEYHPRAVKEMATMPVPPVIAASVPIAMPSRRMLRGHVVAPIGTKIRASISHLGCAISCASEIRNPAILFI